MGGHVWCVWEVSGCGVSGSGVVCVYTATYTMLMVTRCCVISLTSESVCA